MTDEEIVGRAIALANEQLEEMEKHLCAPPGALSTLAAQDDWSFVIKCHALVEGAVSGMLSNALDSRLDKIFQRLELGHATTGKLQFAKALDLMTPGQRGFIMKLSEIRNLLAHDLKHLAFTIPSYVAGFPNDKKRDEFFSALCFDLEGEKLAEWKAVVTSNPKAGILSAVVRILSSAIEAGTFALYDREEGALALNQMITGELRTRDQWEGS